MWDQLVVGAGRETEVRACMHATNIHGSALALAVSVCNLGTAALAKPGVECHHSKLPRVNMPSQIQEPRAYVSLMQLGADRTTGLVLPTNKIMRTSHCLVPPPTFQQHKGLSPRHGVG